MSKIGTNWMGLATALVLPVTPSRADASGAAAEAVSANLPASRLGEMIVIPAGRFLMGNNGQEPASSESELPQHWMELPAYEIGKYEVTRGEYRRFIGFRVARSVPSQPEKGKP